MGGSRRPVGLDLFSGVGGMALGFEQAGFDVAAALEYDPIHAAAHSYNFPLTTMVCADATRTKGKDLLDAVRDGLRSHGVKDWDGQIDCVFGGPPCQAASLAGHRDVDDERNELMFDFMRLAHEVHARTFVIENVPGFLVGDHRKLIDKLLRRFRDNAWTVASPIQTLNAADFGVPQDRKRIFILGAYHGNTLPSYPSPTCRPVTKTPKAKRDDVEGLSDGPTVGDAIADIPDLDAYDELLESDEVVLDAQLIDVVRSDYAKRLRDPWGEGSNDLSTPRLWDPTRLTGSNRTIHEKKIVQRFSKTKQGKVEPVSRFYRLHWDGLSCTLRAGTGRERGAFTAARPIHPTLPRVISVRESMRLHGYPDWVRVHGKKWSGQRQVGNSVPPPLAMAVASSVIRSLGASPKRRKARLELGDAALLSMNMTAAAEYFEADYGLVSCGRRAVKA